MSTALRDGIQRLEVTSRVTIGVLALASGVYTYLSVRELLNGNTTIVFFAAVIYSVAVTIGIFAFWSFLMRLLPHVPHRPGPAVLRHAARFADDHRDVGLAQRHRVGRSGRARTTPREHVAKLQPRPRPGAPVRAVGAEPPSGHSNGVGAFQPARRRREDRHAHRHL